MFVVSPVKILSSVVFLLFVSFVQATSSQTYRRFDAAIFDWKKSFRTNQNIPPWLLFRRKNFFVQVEGEMEVRAVREQDLARVEELVQAAYRGPLKEEEEKEGKLSTTNRAWTTEKGILEGKRTTVEDLKDLISRPNVSVYVAEEEGTAELIGCFYLHLKRISQPEGTEEETIVLLGMLSVDPTRYRLLCCVALCCMCCVLCDVVSRSAV